MQLLAPVGAALKSALATTAGQLQVGGTILSTAGTVAAANSASAVGDWEARQMEERAKAEQAAASQEAENRRKEAEFVMSRARAVGAQSGGGIDYGLLGDIEEEADYRVGMAIVEGDERAKGTRMQSAAARADGQMKRNAGYLRAGRSLLAGGDSLMEKYG